MVDSTLTLHALHQTGLKGDREGHSAKTDKEANIKSVGKFDYRKGVTSKTKYLTILNTTSAKVTVIERKK